MLGHDPRLRLRAAIDHINAHHADAEFCVISGDLVNRGSRSDYDGLRDALERLALPYFPMAGNHDNREMLRRVLDVPKSAMAGFVQYEIETTNGIIACLDTQKSGSDAGEFCKARQAWLRDVMARRKGQNLYLFMHHPPMDLGLPMQDTEKMEEGSTFLDLITAEAPVKFLFIGHVHRPISGVIRGLPFSTMRSVLYQAPSPAPAWDWDSFTPAAEAPMMGVVTLSIESVQLHYDQFCDYSVGAPPKAAAHQDV